MRDYDGMSGAGYWEKRKSNRVAEVKAIREAKEEMKELYPKESKQELTKEEHQAEIEKSLSC